jgi:hypothetical protein
MSGIERACCNGDGVAGSDDRGRKALFEEAHERLDIRRPERSGDPQRRCCRPADISSSHLGGRSFRRTGRSDQPGDKHRWSKQLETTLTITNVTNRLPPLDSATYGGVNYDPSLDQTGAIGRYFELEAHYRY